MSQPRLAKLITAFTATLLALVSFAQSTTAPHSSHLRAISSQQNAVAAPLNLRVLPRNLTGKQVHEIMEQWSRDLGVRCKACHVTVSGDTSAARSPRLNFSDDSMPMKSVARTMFTMTDRINVDFIAHVEGSGLSVTCGTCHRGSLGLQQLVAPSDKQRTTPDAAASWGQPR